MKMIYLETNPKGFVRFVGGPTGVDEVVMHTGVAVDVPEWLSKKLVTNPTFGLADFEAVELEPVAFDVLETSLIVEPKRRGRPPKIK